MGQGRSTSKILQPNNNAPSVKRNRKLGISDFQLTHRCWDSQYSQPIWLATPNNPTTTTNPSTTTNNHNNNKSLLRILCKYQLHNTNRIPFALRQLHLLKSSPINHFIHLTSAFQDSRNLYTVYTFLRGCTLRQLLNQRTFEQSETKLIICSLISIVEYVHSQGLVICDLSPDHVVYDADTHNLRIVELLQLSKTGEFFDCSVVVDGNPYSAPEVLMMDIVQYESDFYSIGVIMYEMMTQRRAVGGMGVGGMRRAEIVEQAITVSKSDLPEGWAPEAADFLIKLLIKAPEYRLGRSGSYQLRKHPWLLNFDWDEVTSSRHHIPIDCSQQFKPATLQPRTKRQIYYDRIFQNQFFDYKFTRS